MRVTLFTKVDCQPCRLTAKRLDRIGLPVDVVSLDGDAGARERVAAMGFASAPVVVVDCGDDATWSWCGYRPSELEKLEKLVAA